MAFPKLLMIRPQFVSLPCCLLWCQGSLVRLEKNYYCVCEFINPLSMRFRITQPVRTNCLDTSLTLLPEIGDCSCPWTFFFWWGLNMGQRLSPKSEWYTIVRIVYNFLVMHVTYVIRIFNVLWCTACFWCIICLIVLCACSARMFPLPCHAMYKVVGMRN